MFSGVSIGCELLTTVIADVHLAVHVLCPSRSHSLSDRVVTKSIAVRYGNDIATAALLGDAASVSASCVGVAHLNVVMGVRLWLIGRAVIATAVVVAIAVGISVMVTIAGIAIFTGITIVVTVVTTVGRAVAGCGSCGFRRPIRAC